MLLTSDLLPRLISRSSFLEQCIASGACCDKLVVGVAIIHPLTAPLQVLIVQRAAHEKVLPNIYELPGGHVEDSDTSILHAAAREVLEETGIVVDEFIGEIPSFEYSVEKILAAEGIGSTTTTTKKTIQLNFVTRLAPISSTEMLKVTIDPHEHQNYAWVSKEDLEQYPMTEGMKKIVTDALEWGHNNIDQFVTDLRTKVGTGITTV